MKLASLHDGNQNNAILLPSTQSGFTLIEMMVVVVILSIFAGMMTLSVGSTESRKNRAFYEHLIDSLSYVRLVSAERMQPMGLMMQADNQGQVQPVIVKLNNPYAQLEAKALNGTQNSQHTRNAMELTAMSSSNQASTTPTWVVEDEVTLPKMPPNVTIEVTALDSPSSAPSSQFAFTSNQSAARPTLPLQPWFIGTDVPQALWFGTGGAAPVRIEVRHNKRLVGDAIILLPDGRVKAGE